MEDNMAEKTHVTVGAPTSLTETDPCHPDFMPANRQWAWLKLGDVKLDDPRVVHLPGLDWWEDAGAAPF
jgi:hypothetical protein